MRLIYESRLEDVLEHRPGLDRARLEATINAAYYRWLKAQSHPPALPPKA